MRIQNIEVVHWNPRKYRIPRTQIVFGGRKNNFGDLLGPRVANEILKSCDNETASKRDQKLPRGAVSDTNNRLLAVGSIMHMAKDGDVVWGTGVNGKVAASEHGYGNLDVRAVRGPLTAEWLEKNKKIDVPEIFGDPGLLVGHFWPELRRVPKTRKLTLIPNLNEVHQYRNHPCFCSPVAPLEQVLRRIAESEYVVGSSLHAIVIADSLGVPSALLESGAEPAFKYEDYFRGTGRESYTAFSDLSKAIARASSFSTESYYDPLQHWNQRALVDAFPTDMWSPSGVR
ncbi:polysaccharide pyruvyl transferase family protein [Arthrobacter sp. ISL-69]|uniref:polysaccharide pyruvyl transferase family protein n=1 Tax=Arthrobacter sp. ISL-69 TaxID=2819113 RepID=UPI001BEC85D4|nr:polysaccharide pyruvyl transferase family protein [Arthrobacter sp. ISL-69]MBT2538268.1 polysaccharide pyruvyl transferase family protein [Arthrobacter sp. ISL-69]